MGNVVSCRARDVRFSAAQEHLIICICLAVDVKANGGWCWLQAHKLMLSKESISSHHFQADGSGAVGSYDWCLETLLGEKAVHETQ